MARNCRSRRMWSRSCRGAGLARVAAARRGVLLAPWEAVRRHRQAWKWSKTWLGAAVLRACRVLGWSTSAITARQSWQVCRVCAQQRCVGAAAFGACLAGLGTCGIPPFVGIVAGYAVAWRIARAQVHSHGASCRTATAVVAGASTSFLVGFPYGVLLAAAICQICPSAWLW